MLTLMFMFVLMLMSQCKPRFTIVQSAWSKQRDGYSFAHEICAADADRFKSCISENYLVVSAWILTGSLIECH